MNRGVIVAIVATISLNLSWAHQTLLAPMVKLADYYEFAARAPFLYRLLPVVIFHVLVHGEPMTATGLAAPLDTYAGVFQLGLDAVSLAAFFFVMSKIARHFNYTLNDGIIFGFAGAAALMIVVFGYFMVPNNAFFYPYDFPDLFIAASIFYLCIIGGTRAELLLPVVVILATLNKETALFYCVFYPIFALPRHSGWIRTAVVMCACAACFVLARSATIIYMGHIHAAEAGPQFEFQLRYTLSQFRNPLFAFALLNICSYLYLPVWALRKRLDRTDVLILIAVVGWIGIMSVLGIFRQLRLFAPASTMLYLILARHLTEATGGSPLAPRRGTGSSGGDGRKPA